MNNWNHLGFIVIGWFLYEDASTWVAWMEFEQHDATSLFYFFSLGLVCLGIIIMGNSLLTIVTRAEKELRKRRVNMALNTLTSQDTINNDGGGE